MTESSRPVATLTVSRGPGVGRGFEIGAAPVTIGRQAQCAIQIEETWTSRRHARIAWTGTEYIVEDLDSTNGTFVNGERVVGPHALRSGDRLQLGDQVELAFHVRVLPGGGVPQREPVPATAVPFLQRRSTRIWALVLLGAVLILIIGGIAYYLLSDRGQPGTGTSTAQAAVPEPTTETPTDTPMPVLPATTLTPTATAEATTPPTLVPATNTPTSVPATNTATSPPATNTPTPVPPTKAPTYSHIISLGPGRFGKPLWLEVIKGDYKLVSGATLRPGSAIDVYEDWLTFPAGLAINVVEAEITLKGTTYPPGTELVVNSQGGLEQR